MIEFTASRETLLKPLQMVGGIVGGRQTMPILGNVLLQVGDGEATFVGTDLEVELRTAVGVESRAPGESTLPGRKLLDICRSLPDGAMIEVTIVDDRATLRSGRSRFVLSTLPAEAFPAFEAAEERCRIRLRQGALRQAVQKTQFAMAQQDVRYYLNGMLMEVRGEKASLVATDGHRLALAGLEVLDRPDEDFGVIIPRKGIQELSRLLEEADSEAEIILGQAHIQVVTAEMRFASKLIEGRFPDYENVIPKAGNRTLTCDREGLRQSLGRVSILSNEKYRGIRLNADEGVLKISAHNPEQEEAEEEIPLELVGDSIEVGFNVTYLLDALGACEGEEVRLSLMDSNSSCLIEGVGDHRSKHIVMPIRL